jgi:HD superfamily phosphohydrolase
VSELGRAVRVVDPIHGYIKLTAIERALLDTPAAQRLRYVGQSGLAHLVFPDLRTSRFIHSLGAMHLASRFFMASLDRAEPQDQEAVLDALKEMVSSELGGISDVKVAVEQVEHDGLIAHRVVSRKYGPYVLLVEQGLRLAALFHDLGHLPFSHDFEYALEQLAADPAADIDMTLLQQRAGRDALHERIGHDLNYLLLREAFASNPSESARVSFQIARRILRTSEAQTAQKIRATGGLQTPAEGAYAWLHTLIAGELDVDRCDYVLRDARSYAFDSARFDLQRLIDNFIVVRDPEVENALVPAVRPQGQAAVESFLIARARVYQWGTRHHKVGQVAAALRYATGKLLQPALESARPDHPLTTFVSDLEAILRFREESDDYDEGQAKDLLARFAGYDDQWWMGQLRNSHQEDEWFALACWRTPGPKCLWKRVVDFPVDSLKEWNERLPARTEVERLRQWDNAVRGLREDGVLVIRHRFEPWKPSAATKDHEQPKSALSFYDPGSGLIPVTEFSYPVEALREGWMRDLQVHAFAESNSAFSDSDGSDVLERLMPSP